MKYIILGIIQGLTEFIPVSSSGHLIVIEKLLNINQRIIQIIVFCHLGTLMALFFYFFKDILVLIKSLRIVLHICIATFVTGICALSFKYYFESLFNFSWVVSITLIINGIIISTVRFFLKSKQSLESLGIKDSIGFGFFQALGIIPGISRSGITMVYLMLRGFGRIDAFKFSFLAGIPAIVGAFMIEANIQVLNYNELKEFLILFFVSFLSGIFSLWILKRFLEKNILHYFGYYCIILGIMSMFIIK